MRIVITGGDGQLGRALQRALAGHEVAALSHAQLDVNDEGAVAAVLQQWRPQFVVHAAALTDTALCEREPARADAVNADGAANVARACALIDARLMAISTNEVFDGSGRRPYSEEAVRNPVNAYGRSKLLGERSIHAILDGRETIVRTSWLYGEGANNYVGKVLAAARSGKPVRFATDEVAAPTRAGDLADGIRQLIEGDGPPGTYHLTNSGEASRFEWARTILELAGVEREVVPVTTAELRAEGYAGPRKPLYSTLANSRAAALGIVLRPWREALTEHLEAAPIAG